MSKDFQFYVNADLHQYEGKYVAILDEKVVASGANAKEVLEEARLKFPNKKPALAKVPREETLILWN